MDIHGINCKILTKNGKNAEIEISGQRINISTESLPKTAQVGDVISLYFLKNNDDELTDKKLAQLILEEIMDGK